MDGRGGDVLWLTVEMDQLAQRQTGSGGNREAARTKREDIHILFAPSGHDKKCVRAPRTALEPPTNGHSDVANLSFRSF